MAPDIFSACTHYENLRGMPGPDWQMLQTAKFPPEERIGKFLKALCGLALN